jgi:hypothetical protein
VRIHSVRIPLIWLPTHSRWIRYGVSSLTRKKAMRPVVRWWWPGGDVTAVELRREVRVLDEAGFGGAKMGSAPLATVRSAQMPAGGFWLG